MQVNSFLEAFSMMYGWSLYETFYLLFVMTGVIFFPFARLMWHILIDAVSQNKYSGDSFIKQAIVRFCIAMLVFVLAVVPFDSISVKDVKITSVCVDKQALDKHRNTAYFADGAGAMPIIPALVSSFGQGINGVLYKTTPCVTSISKLIQSSGTIDFSDPSKDVFNIKDMVDRFEKECYQPAQMEISRIKNMDRDGEGADIAKWLEDVTERLASKEDTSTADQELRMGSYLMEKVFYKAEPDYTSNFRLFSWRNPQAVKDYVAKTLPLKSKNSVPGFSSSDPDLSAQQQRNGSGPVNCGEWWGAPDIGVKASIASAQAIGVGMGLAGETAIPECQITGKTNSKEWIEANAAALKACTYAAWKTDSGVSDSNVETVLLEQAYANSESRSSILSWGDRGAVAGLAVGGVLDSIAGIFQVELGLNYADKIGGFFFDMYFLKLIMSILQPLILMGIYMFWLWYMIISGYSGTTLIKGSVIIIVLTVLPGVWAVGEHLKDQLFLAMYDVDELSDIFLNFNMAGIIKALVANNNGTLMLDRVIMYSALTIFELVLPLVLIFMVGQADGGADVRQVNAQDQARVGKTPSFGTNTSGKGKIMQTFGRKR